MVGELQVVECSNESIGSVLAGGLGLGTVCGIGNGSFDRDGGDVENLEGRRSVCADGLVGTYRRSTSAETRASHVLTEQSLVGR